MVNREKRPASLLKKKPGPVVMIVVSAESSSGRGFHSEPREHRSSGDEIKIPFHAAPTFQAGFGSPW